MCVNACVCECERVCVFECVLACVHAFVLSWRSVRVCVYAWECAHIYKQTFKNIHSHTNSHPPKHIHVGRHTY